ncbi:2-phospho-L-lactate guanylyltransferase [Methanobacterium sp.]|uniref:2-phospho-L-lactate guanylyltransferase n=1 Tax=Methanobacterium sp. TaxID=2164 RepID=UPI0025FCF0BE|nr:2-phospho-L-lactate guanylyltransferase [Methanobacterium sp.]MBI5459148.1 2-phospho-L-lactate guanylyltransferase [Methanobacterium sp.]MDY9923031.1 2-phospho-L-lactate guanylyltransferase [Methanobacterium sp.]
MTNTYAIIPVSRFSEAKTRLSPTLTPLERENLLKAMLMDVIGAIKGSVDQVVVISSDKDVLNFVKDLDVTCLSEKGKTDLNGALTQAVEWCSQHASQVLIVPSDVPLIHPDQVQEMVELSVKWPLVIAPAKGGGTNALLCPTQDIKMKFGDWSFFEHLKEAENAGMPWYIYDSFYLSLDVNTAEDLGEIMIHGFGTQTRKFLKSIGLEVKSNHGTERLMVERK